MNQYKIGEVYEVHTPHNNGIFKVTDIKDSTVFYKAATAYLGTGSFIIGSNFSDKSIPLSESDIANLKDRIIEKLNQIIP